MKIIKKLYVIIILIGFILVLLGDFEVFAENILEQKVPYSKEYQDWLKLSDEEREKIIQPRMYDIKYTKIQFENPFLKASMLRTTAIDEEFTLKSLINNNLRIRNQQETGTCWAFSALSSLETNLALKNYKNNVNTSKEYDFSERHMEYATSRDFNDDKVNPIGYNRTVGSGGNWGYATSYLTNGSGAINEAQMQFENNEDVIDIDKIQNKDVISQVYDTVEFPDYNDSLLDDDEVDDIINQIKYHIQNYGSVSGGIWTGLNAYSGNKISNSTGAVALGGGWANHAISIIGWDDKYETTNWNEFEELDRPTSKGAWIARNSWGEDKGKNGLIYISYEDKSISKTLAGIVKANDYVEYDNIYQASYYYPNAKIISGSRAVLCNNFDKKTNKDEYLTQVSLHIPETYSCKVYVNSTGTGKSKNDLKLVRLKSGDSQTITAGYHTLEFAKPIKITSNKFAVAVEMTTVIDGTTVMPSIVAKNESEYSPVEVQTGKSFLIDSYKGEDDWESWKDLAQDDCVSTIKAFTTLELNDGSLKNIEITTPPNKTAYYEGENFDKDGMVVKANYNSKIKPSEILDSSNYSITNGTNLKEGQTKVTITYEDQSVNQAITVEKNSVTELKIKTPPTKTEYKEGENFDKTGMVVEATRKNGKKEIVNNYIIENGNNLKVEQTKVKISYEGKSVEQEVTVKSNPLVEIKIDKEITGISINKKPNKLKYIQNKEDLDLSGGILTVSYNDGTKENINMDSENIIVEGFNNKNVGKIEIKLTYLSTITKLEIEIIEEVKAKNSNISDAKCDVKEVQAYFYTTSSSKDYTLVNIEINNISRNLDNDELKYYYYLSSNANEQNIEDWTEIKEKQEDNNKLQFTVDSRKVPNYKEISSKDNIYIYIKEVAIKGGNQSVIVSKSMKIETKNNIETYIDDKKKEDLQSNNKKPDNSALDNKEIYNEGDKTTSAPVKLPNTGWKITAIILSIIVLTAIGIFLYIKYKNLSKYV